MKRIIAVALLLCLLAGCQPTPEEEIVTNKADNSLEAAIHKSEPVASDAPEAVCGTLRQTLAAPEHWTDAYEGDIYGGRLYVNIDAAVEVPEVNRVPVFAGRLDGPRAEETERLCKLLLGEGPYEQVVYDRKAAVLEEIKLYQAWLDAIDEGLYGDAAVDRETYEPFLQAYYEEYRKAEEPPAPEPWTGSFADKPFSVMNADGNQFQWNDHYMRYMDRGAMYLEGRDPRGAHPARTDAEQDAEKTAEAFIQTLGVCGAKALGIFAFDEQVRRQLNTEEGFDAVYFVNLAPVYAGIPVYAFLDQYHGSYYGAVAAGYMEEEYAAAPEQESISIGIRDGRVAHCMWMKPFHVTETVNENVTLLPFDEIKEIFRKNIFLSIFADEDMSAIRLYVTDVKLSYMRIRQKDSDAYWLLPVWDFLGYAKKSENEQLNEQALREFAGQTLLTVNAIDGSVIDRTFGY